MSARRTLGAGFCRSKSLYSIFMWGGWVSFLCFLRQTSLLLREANPCTTPFVPWYLSTLKVLSLNECPKPCCWGWSPSHHEATSPPQSKPTWLAHPTQPIPPVQPRVDVVAQLLPTLMTIQPAQAPAPTPPAVEPAIDKPVRGVTPANIDNLSTARCPTSLLRS